MTRLTPLCVVLSGCVAAENGWLREGPTWRASDVPIGVCAASYALSGPLPAVDRAIVEINMGVGSIVLERRTRRCDIRVALDVPTMPGERQDIGGLAAVTERACSVVVRNVAHRYVTRVVTHELLHCLGLDHDAARRSIMRETYDDLPTELGMSPTLTAYDADLLRRHYVGGRRTR